MNVDLLGDDDWDDMGRPRRRRPSPHHMRSGGMLDPHFGGAGLYRSRSQGHGVAPQINIYNRQDDNHENRSTSPYPAGAYPPGAFPAGAYPVPYPVSSSRHASPRASPDGRGRGRSRLGDRLGEELESELAEIALEHRYGGRSRSRARTDAQGWGPSMPGYEYELARREAELRERSRERSRERAWKAEEERSRERAWKLEEERIKATLRLKALEEELKKDKDHDAAKEREKQLIADYERRQREADEKKEAAEKRAVEEFERKQREAKDKATAEERRIREKIERDAKEAKEKKEREYREFKEQERKEKEEQDRKYNEFLREQKEREEKKKREAKEAEDKFQAEMRKRLANMGYTEKTIDVLVDQEKAKQFKHDVEVKDTRINIFQAPSAPIYPKVHRDYLDIETLKYYGLPWEYDRSNPEYIIILRHMETRETDVLFEHTKSLRKRLLLEPAKKEKQFALYRKRSKSRSGAPKEIGVLRLR